MSCAQLIQTMEKLYELHEQLYDIALKKTDVLKNNEDISKLQELLKIEQTYSNKIHQVENERMKVVDDWLGQQEDKSLSACIEKATGNEKEQLVQLKERLKEIIEKLKSTNELNQQLIHHALQFVNLTIDMVMPQEPSLTYSNPNQTEEKQGPKRSMFDSKA